MKRLLILSLVLGMGVTVGRLFDGVPRKAEAGGEQEKCAAKNGDVNADGGVDLSDAITILGNLFLGNPTELVPLCSTAAPAGLPDTGQTTCYDQGGAEIPCNSVCPGQDGRYATGCPSEGRFTDNGDGKVTDICTGLMWQRDTADTNGDGQPGNDRLWWCAALDYCENLSFAGHEDWRLPNARELQSIVDHGRFDPAIDPVFGAFSSSAYWSSTSGAGGPDVAWNVGFYDGDIYVDAKDSGGRVRAVRGGP